MSRRWRKDQQAFYFGHPVVVLTGDVHRRGTILVAYAEVVDAGVDRVSSWVPVRPEHLRAEYNDEALMLDTELLMTGLTPARVFFKGD